MRKLAHWMHLALCALLIAMPTFGAMSWYLGLGWAGDLHEISVNVLLILVGVHAAAALFHHYVLKDGLIDRMRRPG